MPTFTGASTSCRSPCSPLHSRRQDIRAIAAALLLRHSPADEALPWPTANALDRLMAHGWPGNVRELENVLQRAMLLHDGDRIEAGDLVIEPHRRPAFRMAAVDARHPPPRRPMPRRPSAASDAKRISRRRASKTRAATAVIACAPRKRLGISERTLRYRLAEMRAVA